MSLDTPHDVLTPTGKLLAMLDLPRASASAHEQVFPATTLAKESPRIFGGQVLAQALVAATRTVEDKKVHSLHGYFLRPGDVNADLSYGVETLNDTRSFSSRRVQAYQGGVPIFSCIASFQAEAAGPEHASEMPTNLPDPESLPTAADLLGHIDLPIAQKVAHGRPFDIRHISPALYLTPDASSPASNLIWFKTKEKLPSDPLMHQAAIAYASDYTQIEPVLRRHQKTWLEPGMKVASLDHTIWFHRPAPADEWLLLAQDSPSSQGARGLSLGKIFTRDGQHIATVAQESLIRLPEYRTN